MEFTSSIELIDNKLLWFLYCNCFSIPAISSFSLSNITNIASVSIANIDLLKQTSPLSLDLIAQHCTLLPPELVHLPPVTSLASLSPATTTFISQEQDIVNNNNIQEVDTIITPVHIKEVKLYIHI